MNDPNKITEEQKSKSVVILNKDNEKVEIPVPEFLEVLKEIPPGGQKDA